MSLHAEPFFEDGLGQFGTGLARTAAVVVQPVAPASLATIISAETLNSKLRAIWQLTPPAPLLSAVTFVGTIPVTMSCGVLAGVAFIVTVVSPGVPPASSRANGSWG